MGADRAQPRTGVAWYRPWEWERLRQVVSDPERPETTHTRWLRTARKACRERLCGARWEAPSTIRPPAQRNAVASLPSFFAQAAIPARVCSLSGMPE